MQNIAKLAPLLLISALMVSSADAQPGDYRRTKKAAKLAVIDLSAVKRFASRLQGSEAERIRQLAARMGLPDQDHDGIADVLEQIDGTDACNAMSDGQHQDGSLRKREGAIDDISDFSITVDDLDFVLDGATEYIGLTQDELDLDVCVEVSGFEDQSGDIIASRVASSDACGDSPSPGSSPFGDHRPFGGRHGGRD